MYYPGYNRPFLPDVIHKETLSRSEVKTCNKCCLILSETQKYGSEGVVYFNYKKNVVLIVAYELPSLLLVKADYYAGYVKKVNSEKYNIIPLKKCQDEIWTGKVFLDYPLENIDKIMVCGVNQKNEQAFDKNPVILLGSFSDSFLK